MKKSDDLSIYSRPAPGYEIEEVMGKGLIDAPYETLVNALMDFRNYPKYFEGIKSVKLVEKVSGNHYIFHTHVNSPWPLSERDSICSRKFYLSKNRLQIHSIGLKEHPKVMPEKDGMIRVTKFEEIWELSPLGEKTFAIYRTKTDPGGSVPKSLANYTMDRVVKTTLIDLRKMAKHFINAKCKMKSENCKMKKSNIYFTP